MNSQKVQHKFDRIAIVLSFLTAIVYFVFIGNTIYSTAETAPPDRPDNAVVSLQIVEPINDVAGVGLIMRMHPATMPTLAGDGNIQKGNEIYFKAPDSLASQLRIAPDSYMVTRCVRITHNDYGWKVIEVFTRYKCQQL